MKKVAIWIVVLLVLIIVICGVLGYKKLADNKTFFKTTYVGYDHKERFIPKYSYLEQESGNYCASFKSLRSKKDLENEINEYLKDFEYFDNNDNPSNEYGLTHGYRKGDLFIQSYSVKDEGLFRRIYLYY